MKKYKMKKRWIMISMSVILCSILVGISTGCSRNTDRTSSRVETVITAGNKADDSANEIAEGIFDSSSIQGYSQLTTEVNLNQIGFEPQEDKIAIVSSNTANDKFTVVDESGNTVYTGKLSKYIEDTITQQNVRYADFSDFSSLGIFYVMCGEELSSLEFQIMPNLYNGELKSILQSYEIKRDVIESGDSTKSIGQYDTQYSGEYRLENGYDQGAPETKFYASDLKKEVSGGWEDSEGASRQSLTTIKGTANFLLAYEFFQQDLELKSLVVEGVALQEMLLEEVKYGLDWLLKMQDEESGGVYNKVSTKVYGEGQEKIFGSSTNVTASFAAVMSIASRVYSEENPTFAEECLNAAAKAWSYLEANQEVVLFKNPSDVTTKAYTDTKDSDERYWAACELFKTTKKQTYHTYLENYVKKEVNSNFTITEVAGYGNIAYLTTDQAYQKKEIVAIIEENMKKCADTIINVQNKEPYRVVASGYDVSAVDKITSDAMMLVLMGKVMEEQKYIKTADAYVDFLLGANPNSMNYMEYYLGLEEDDRWIDFESSLFLLLLGLG